MKRTVTSIAMASLVFGVVVVGGSQEAWAGHLQNGNFEASTAGNPPSGWTTYVQSTKSGNWTIQTTTPAEGSQYQQTQVYNVSSWGGVRQNVAVVSGLVYTIAGSYRTNSGSSTASVRYSLTADTSRTNSTVLVSKTETVWSTFSQTVTAMGGTLTLFLDHINGTSSNKAAAFDNITVTVNCPTVEVPTNAAASVNPVCSGTTTILSASPGSGGDEVWWFTDSCGGSQAGTGLGNQTVNPTSTITYYARTKISGADCWSTCAEVTITVIPPATVNAGGPYTGCAGTAINIAGSMSNATSPFWTTTGTGTFADANALITVYTPSENDTPSVTLTLNANAASPCPTVQSNAAVTVNTSPSVPTAAAAVAENGAITWNWGTVNNATSYKLSDSWGNIIATGLTNNYFVESGVDLSAVYSCHVQAVNVCGTSGPLWTQLPSPSAQSSSAPLQNGGMEAFTGGGNDTFASNWQTYYHGGAPEAWHADFNVKHGGRYSQQIQMHDTGDPAPTQSCGLRQTISASPGDAFTFVARGKTFHNNTTYAGLFIGAQWNGSTTPPTFSEDGQGGNTFFSLTPASGIATGTTVTVFLHAQMNGHAGDDQIVWFDDAVGYRAYVPPAPTVNNATLSTMDVSVNPGNNSSNDQALYAISIGGGSYTLGTHWVQATGSVGTTPTWQNENNWGTKTVTGLSANTAYTFKVKACYDGWYNQPTSLGAGMTVSTLAPDAPLLDHAVSRKTYGDPSHNWDTLLPLDAVGNAGVECRAGGPTQVVLVFTRAVYNSSGNSPGLNEVTATINGVQANDKLIAVTMSADQKEMTVHLTDVPNEACVSVTVNGLKDISNHTLYGDNDVYVRALLGDVDGDGVVNATDIGLIPSAGGAVSSSNYRYDTNLDGTINSRDKQAVGFGLCTSAACSGG